MARQLLFARVQNAAVPSLVSDINNSDDTLPDGHMVGRLVIESERTLIRE